MVEKRLGDASTSIVALEHFLRHPCLNYKYLFWFYFSIINLFFIFITFKSENHIFKDINTVAWNIMKLISLTEFYPDTDVKNALVLLSTIAYTSQ